MTSTQGIRDEGGPGGRILVVEDDPGLRALYHETLSQRGHEVDAMGTATEALSALAQRDADLIVLDYSLPDMRADSFIAEATRRNVLRPFIVATGQGDEQVAVDMMKRGARDYLVKDQMFLSRLGSVVGRVLTELRAERLVAAANAARMESEARFQQVILSMPALVAAYGDDLTVQFWNRECERVLGYSAAEIVGTPRALEMLCPDPEYRERRVAELRGDRGHVFKGWEWEFVAKDGSRRTVAWTSISEQVQVPGWSFWAVGIDVTAATRTRAVLQTTTDRFNLLARATNDAIWDWDIAAGTVWRNDAYEVLFGHPVTDFGNDSEYWISLVHPEERATVRKMIEDALAARLPSWACEYRVRRADGSYAWVFDRGYVIHEDDGRPLRMIGAMQDITARRVAEDEVRRLNAELESRVRDRTAQLQTAMKELETFAYSVSHDLRAPLRAIDGFTQAIVEDCATLLDDTGRGYLERVRKGCARMGALIENLLELSRVTRADMHRTPVDLAQLACSVLAEVVHTEPREGVDVTIHPMPAARCDPGLLRIALTNLLANAWKFTRHTAAPRIEFGTADQDGVTVYFVRDNGAGFDMGHAAMLFAPFRRLHSEAEFEGSGVGLATVQRIVSRHGGRIWAESRPEGGATFFFTLPV